MNSAKRAAAALVLSAVAMALPGAGAAAGAPGVVGAGPAQRPAPDPGSRGEAWPGKRAGTVGKLVVVLPGGQRDFCTAAVVDAPNGSTAATAAHCLANPEHRQKPQAVYFLPGYHRGGTGSVVRDGWRASGWRTSPQWDERAPLEEILPHDWAFVRFPERGGRTLQETHGANRIRFGPAAEGGVLSLGYPQLKPYDGEALHYCGGRAHVYREQEIGPANAGELALSPCRMTQGVSGGPWIRGWSPSRQSGTVVAVTSVGADGELLGRPFTGPARSVFEAFAR